MKKCCRLVGTFSNNTWKACAAAAAVAAAADGHHVYEGFPGGSAGKESAYNAGHLGLIPGLGRSPEEGKGYPPQNSGLENSMDCGWERVGHDWVTFTFHFHSVMSSGRSWKKYSKRGRWSRTPPGLERCYSHCLKIITWKDFISLSPTEMQIKTANYLRLAFGKKSTNNKCWRGCEEKGALLHRCWHDKLLTARMEDSVEVP